MEDLIKGYPRSFLREWLPNNIYEGLIIYDPNGKLQRVKEFVMKRRFLEKVVELRIQKAFKKSALANVHAKKALRKSRKNKTIMLSRYSAFKAISTALELNKMIINKRLFLDQLKISCDNLGMPDLCNIYFDILKPSWRLDKRGVREYIREMKDFINRLVGFSLQIRETASIDQKMIETFLLRASHFNKFIEGLLILCNQGKFLDVLRLVQLEVIYEIGDFLSKMKSQLYGKPQTYSFFPILDNFLLIPDFQRYYKKLLCLENIPNETISTLMRDSSYLLAKMRKAATMDAFKTETSIMNHSSLQRR